MHFDQNTIFIIVAAVIGISRLIAQIAESARERSQRREQQAKQGPSERRRPIIATAPKTDEERVREFLEALGAPKGAAPPPKVQPRTDFPPRPLAPSPPPPISRPFSPVPLEPIAEKVRKIFTPPPPPLVTAPPPPSEADAPGAWLREEEKIESAATRFEAAQAAAATITPAAATMNWQEALRSRESVRAALVLREILGPPRALRELGFAPKR